MHRDFLDFNCLTLEEWEHLFNLASDIYDNPLKYSERCKNKILAALFYEPSTRTKFSFQAAMLKLGGNNIGFSGTAESSVSKGESLKDTIKIAANYSDIIVMRHQKDGAPFAASLYSKVPVINAGDGKHLHPTQTLMDLFTIGRMKNKNFENLNIGLCGDLLNGRTVHSLLRAFNFYSGNTFYLISEPDFKVPEKYLEILKNKNKIIICEKITDCIENLDIIYMTRLQRERIADKLGRVSDNLILDKNKLNYAKTNLIIMHPLPRNEEISEDIDEDPRAVYFKQAEFGLYIRMALLITLLENKNYKNLDLKLSGQKCANPDCIINGEKNLPDYKNKDNKCAYCEH